MENKNKGRLYVPRTTPESENSLISNETVSHKAQTLRVATDFSSQDQRSRSEVKYAHFHSRIEQLRCKIASISDQ